MTARISLILFFLLAGQAFAQRVLENGQLAGTFETMEGSSPISYFVESSNIAANLENWAAQQKSQKPISEASKIYDNFIVIQHPEGILDGQINPDYSAFAKPEVISELNKVFASVAVWLSSKCVKFPLALVDDGGGKTLVMFVYVLSRQHLDECMDQAFKEIP